VFGAFDLLMNYAAQVNRPFQMLQKTLQLISSGCLNLVIIGGRGGGPFVDLAGDVTLSHIALCQTFVKPFLQILDSFTLNVGIATSSERSETLRGITRKSDPTRGLFCNDTQT
jgi:hypothetical protein